MSYIYIISEVNSFRKVQAGEDSADISEHKHRLKDFIMKSEKIWEYYIHSAKEKIKGKCFSFCKNMN